MATQTITLPSLAHANPIVLADGRPSPYFQRFWQNITIKVTVGEQAGVDISGKVDKNTSTGWAGASGTTSKGTFAVYAAPAISNPPTQAEVQALANHVQVLSQHLAAVVGGLMSASVFSA